MSARSASSLAVDVQRGGGIDRRWDAFVERAPGGHHLQTSLWGEVKGVVGWKASRVIVHRKGEIVSGGQLLVRRLGPVAVGYVTRGPVTTDESSARAAVDGLEALARSGRVFYLKVQPPVGDEWLVRELLARRYVESGLAAGPTATVRVDLRPSPEALLAGMRAGTRSNIGKARRKGVTVRAGDDADMGTFFRLVEATSRRQGFAPYPRAYYERMWRLFSAEGRARLVLGEHEGTVLTALLLIGYGDTAVYKMGGWSGDRTGIHPNEAAHWAGMLWAKEAGYRYYDLEGIDRGLAASVLSGEDVPRTARLGADHFKLGFGGTVVLLPVAYDRSPFPVVAGAVRRIAPSLDRWDGLAGRLIGRRS